jgi:hypothetical protein
MVFFAQIEGWLYLVEYAPSQEIVQALKALTKTRIQVGHGRQAALIFCAIHDVVLDRPQAGHT